MKQWIIVLLFLQLCILLTGCRKNPSLNLSKYNDWSDMNVESSIIKSNEEKELYDFTFLVKNNEEEDIYFSTKWYLEVFKDESWYTIDFKCNDIGKNYGWDDVKLLLEYGEEIEITIPLYGYYQTPLHKGKYRIIQPIDSGRLFSLHFTI